MMKRHLFTKCQNKRVTSETAEMLFNLEKIICTLILLLELPPTYLTVEVGDSWARGSSTPSNQANPVFQRFYDQA